MEPISHVTHDHAAATVPSGQISNFQISMFKEIPMNQYSNNLYLKIARQFGGSAAVAEKLPAGRSFGEGWILENY